MSQLGALVRAGLKSNFGVAVFCHRIFREKKDRWILLLSIVSLLGLVPMLYGFIAFIQTAYAVLKPLRQEGALVAIGIITGQLLILVFGIYYVIAALYFSRDIELLIPLPLRPSQVLLSKFIIITINEYLTVAVFVLPFLIAFGILDGRGMVYWLMAAMVYLALPLLPLAIITIFVVAMMRFVNISRKKDILIIAGGVAVLTMVFGFQLLVQSSTSDEMTPQDMAAILSAPDSLPGRITAAFPPGLWAARALSHELSANGLMNLAAFLGASMLAIGAILLMGDRCFYKGVIGLSEQGVHKKTLTSEEMSRRVSSGRRAVSAIFFRELKIMNRTPVFLLNGVLIVIILPAFFLILPRSGAESPTHDLQILVTSGHSLLFVLFAALFMTVCGSLNGTASSTFSREGTQFWISRVIPVPPREQIAAKFLHSYAISVIGILAAAAVVRILLPIQFTHLAAAIGIALLTAVLMTVVGMFIDLARPLLDWINPQKAIKQNLNVLLAMMANASILGAAYFAIKALIRHVDSDRLILLVICAGLTALAAGSYMGLLRFADKRYREIEG